MLISLSSYLVSIWTRHCNVSTKNLLSPVCANSSYHLFSALSINADHPMAEQNREWGGKSTIKGRRKGEQMFQEDGAVGAMERERVQRARSMII